MDLDSEVSKEQAQRLIEEDSGPIQGDEVEKPRSEPNGFNPLIRRSQRAKKPPAWRDDFV